MFTLVSVAKVPMSLLDQARSESTNALVNGVQNDARNQISYGAGRANSPLSVP